MTLFAQSKTPLLPAIVIGYPSHDFRRPEGLADDQYKYWLLGREFPAWLFQIEHASGGSAHYREPIFGCVLRLESNTDKALLEPDELIKFLRRQPGMLTEPAAASLWTIDAQTRYEAPALALAKNILGKYFRLPPIVSGRIGSLVFTQCNPLDYFIGWKLTSLKLSTGSDVDSIFASREEHIPYTPRSVLFELKLTMDTGPGFNEEQLSELWSLRHHFKTTEENLLPGIYLFWDN